MPVVLPGKRNGSRRVRSFGQEYAWAYRGDAARGKDADQETQNRDCEQNAPCENWANIHLERPQARSSKDER